MSGSKCWRTPLQTWTETKNSVYSQETKALEEVKYREAHHKHTCTSAGKPFVPDRSYCTVCTPLGRKCPSKFPDIWQDITWHSKKVSPEPKPVPEPRTWIEAMARKKLAAIKYRDAHIEETCAAKASGVTFIPERDYCPICASIERKCPSVFPGCQDWKNSDAYYSDWDADLEEQYRKGLESEKDNEARAPF